MASRILPIQTNEEYELALERLMALLDAEEGSPQAAEREALLEAIEEYEDEEGLY
jgi:antitoxin component HigA of HigAB toxin-antitoxin module